MRGNGGRAARRARGGAGSALSRGRHDRLAPRCAVLRPGGRRLARLERALALPPRLQGPLDDLGARPPATLGLRPGRRGAHGLAALATAEQGAALLDHLPHAEAAALDARAAGEWRGADPARLGHVDHDAVGAAVLHLDVAAVTAPLANPERLVDVVARRGTGRLQP